MNGISAPASAGPIDGRERGAALDRAVGLRHSRLVLADELGENHSLGREVRRHEAAEERDERQQELEAERVGRVQERDRDEDRRAREVGEQHGVPSPSRCTTEPLGMPRIAIGRSSAARTRHIFPGEPVVTSTNHGSARYVIRVPSTEMVSAVTSAATAVFFTPVAAGRPWRAI